MDRINQIEMTLERCRLAQSEWVALSSRDRERILLQIGAQIEDNLQDLIQVIINETGKPRLEIISSEILSVVELIRYYAMNSQRILRSRKLSWNALTPHKISKKFYLPLGVVGIISPWNFPFSIPMGETLTALFAGNGILLKPSEFTPRISLWMDEFFKSSSLPPNLVQVLHGGVELGKALVESSVDKILFTGSVPTGRKIGAKCGELLKACSLELGGKDAMVVCADADLDLAVEGACWGSMMNSGQACASIERILVHESIADVFMNKLKDLVESLRSEESSPAYESTELGRIIASKQVEVYKEQLQEFNGGHGKVLTGGSLSAKEERLQPTIVLCEGGEKVWKEESFGPVVAIKKFISEEEAILMANDSPFGLLASVWSRDEKRAQKIAMRLEAGTILINDCVYTHAIPQIPWFGVKSSGYGSAVHGEEGLLALVQMRQVHYDRFGFPLLRPIWWFPYENWKFELLKALITWRNPSSKAKMRELPNLLKGFWGWLESWWGRRKG